MIFPIGARPQACRHGYFEKKEGHASLRVPLDREVPASVRDLRVKGDRYHLKPLVTASYRCLVTRKSFFGNSSDGEKDGKKGVRFQQACVTCGYLGE